MKILIVKDEPELARSIAEYLHDEHYRCEFAATFTRALAKIDAYTYDG